LAALRSGKNALEKLHNENTLEDVLKLMEEVDEQNELEREINAALVSTGESLTGIEEEDLELELQALMGGAAHLEDVKVQLPEVPTNKLPEVQVPSTKPVEKEKPGRVAVAS